MTSKKCMLNGTNVYYHYISAAARLHKNGIIANDIHLVVKSWHIDMKDVGMIFTDDTTSFATIKDIIDSRDSSQCRKLLGLADNIDLAIICTITMCNAYVNDDLVLNSWVASDMVNSSIRVSANFPLSEDMKKITVGTICAILNPDVREQITQCGLKCVNIKQPDDLLIIGELDGIKLCNGVTTKGTACKNFVYTHNQGEFCKFHLKGYARSKSSSAKLKTKSESDNHVSSILDPNTHPSTKSFTFNAASAPSRPRETMSKLGDLNLLVQKVMNGRPGRPNATLRPVTNGSTTVSNLSDNTKTINIGNSKDFERLANIIRDYSLSDSKDYKKILGSLQLIHRRISGISQDLIAKCDILTSCTRLLDHPIETIAVGSLKLRRALKKYIKSCAKDISAPTFTSMNNRKKSLLTSTKKLSSNIMEDLDSIISLTSNVDMLIKEEERMKISDRLRDLENMDKAEEYKQTIEYIDVLAFYCQECSMATEAMNPYCRQEGHAVSRKKVKKETHCCVNENCKCRYYSLDGHKPPFCPKCKESTVISEKVPFYKPRSNYLMPNERLLDCEPGAYRPRDSDS